MGMYKKQLFGYNQSAVEQQQKQTETLLKERDIQLLDQQAQVQKQQEEIVLLEAKIAKQQIENEELTKKVEKLSHEVANYDNIEQTLSTALVVAQEAAQNLRVMAAKEAQLIVQQAQEQAKAETQAALKQVETIQLQAEQLKRESHVFKTRIRMLLEAQLELNADEVWNQIFEPIQHEANTSIEGEQVNQAQSCSELGMVEA